jgi:hypothetical protein
MSKNSGKIGISLVGAQLVGPAISIHYLLTINDLVGRWMNAFKAFYV